MCYVEDCKRKVYHVDDDGNRYCRKHGVRFPLINPHIVKVKPRDVFKAHWISVQVEQKINFETREVKVIRGKDKYVSGYIPIYDEAMIPYWTSMYYNVNHVTP